MPEFGAMPNAGCVLQACALSVGFDGHTRPVLAGLDLRLSAGECVGLVGSSGSGKSMTARALLGLLPEGARKLSGSVSVGGRELRMERDFAAVRGSQIAYVFQDAAASLHPLKRIGAQLAECARVHGLTRARTALSVVADALQEVGLEVSTQLLRAYPHQLSGGQRQRVMLALTLLPRPAVLIADEPTSALDPVLARRVCDLLAQLVSVRGMALLLISHDLPRVAELCSHVLVLDHGNVVESGAPAQLMAHGRAAATQRLTAALKQSPYATSIANTAAPVLQADSVGMRFQTAWRWPWMPACDPVLQNIHLTLKPAERLGVVGSSGSGKSTLARVLLGLLPTASGEVRWFGKSLAQQSASIRRAWRPRVQMVFQDPMRSLDPLQRIDAMLALAQSRAWVDSSLDGGSRLTRAEIEKASIGLLESVGLDASTMRRYPNQFSGGQRQRLAIARALATCPQVLICDEATSALDSATQAQILDLLDRLAFERQLALIFIAHDLLAVARLCQRLIVLDAGRVVEVGDARECIANPQSDALRALVAAMPIGWRST